VLLNGDSTGGGAKGKSSINFKEVCVALLNSWNFIALQITILEFEQSNENKPTMNCLYLTSYDLGQWNILKRGELDWTNMPTKKRDSLDHALRDISFLWVL